MSALPNNISIQNVSQYVQEYHNLTPQTNPRYREEEPQKINRNKTSERQLKQSNQLFLSQVV